MTRAIVLGYGESRRASGFHTACPRRDFTAPCTQPGSPKDAGHGTQIALKFDVETLRSTRESVPILAEICRRHAAPATFAFCVGPHHAGRVLRAAFLSTVSCGSIPDRAASLALARWPVHPTTGSCPCLSKS
jgi:hypothetical protein